MKRLIIILIGFVFYSCEDEISIDLKDAPSALVVDAWINDKPEPQVISLTATQGYFNSEEPRGIAGATVEVKDSKGNTFEFRDNLNGKYTWNPTNVAEKIESEGTLYQLRIELNGKVYTASSSLNRVPIIDSLKFTFKEEQNVFQPEGYYGEFVATDFRGQGDTYWIKAYKNGVFLNNPFDLNIAYDAGFNAGGNIDGVVFIQPIQDAVTPLNDDLDAIEPYIIGDSLYVEIHSITNEAFYFLQEVQIQTQRNGGFDEIFAEPLENVSTNIVDQTPDQINKVIGFFNVSSVSGRGRKLME
uniref:DUF4249 domain-containing protein n=1 Tax=Fulvivirga sp. TaxID=1931237 RepID=UPI00404A4A66